MNRYRYTPPHTRRRPQPFPTEPCPVRKLEADWLKVVFVACVYVVLLSGLCLFALHGGAHVVGVLVLISLAAAGVLWACVRVGREE